MFINALGLVGAIRGGGLSGSAAESSIDSGAKATAATGEVASSGGKPTAELSGGQKAQTPDAINVDIRPDIQSGIRADATKLPFRDNSLGEVVASNPFIPKSAGGTNSMMDFLPEATRVVEPGGKIFINANAANPYGKIPSASELESLGLRVI
ncbi:methyltransferase domain-containing protein [Pseudomonas fakonensis]|uniref:methyltransferase domain-containing protein n=1 Tax=Pseudomonas fakonensis TaxID=2842355 RepID=UPI001CEC76FC|nr:methyltransferase domain-containing protein [Pseudomonas fakonensis]